MLKGIPPLFVVGRARLREGNTENEERVSWHRVQ